MVGLYPYDLYVKQNAVPSTKDDNGDFVATSATFELAGKCRDEVNANGQTVQLVDGAAVQFTSMVYLPLSVTDVPTGLSIKVMNDSVVRCQGTVKRFERGQLHCRLWV